MHLTLLHYIGIYLAASYLLGALWFLVLERKDGFTKWRVIATAVAPLALPLMLLAGVGLKLLDLSIKIKDKPTAK